MARERKYIEEHKRRIEQPAKVRTDMHDEDTYTHPAFGTLTACRVSGQINLFGSNIPHNGFMRVELSTASLTTGPLMHDHVHGGHEIIARVDMSEAQWVAFISRTNVGGGVPCTIDMRQVGPLERMPELPDFDGPAQKLAGLIDSKLLKNQAHVKKHAKATRELLDGLPVRKREAIEYQLGLLEQHLMENHEYAGERLINAKEQLVLEAKMEMEATVSAILTRLGLDNIQQLQALAQQKTLSPPADATDDPYGLEQR